MPSSRPRPVLLPASAPHPDYERWTRELALITIASGNSPDSVAFADSGGCIGAVFAELKGTGPREAARMLRRMRSGLRVVDGGGETVTGARPPLRLV